MQAACTLGVSLFPSASIAVTAILNLLVSCLGRFDKIHFERLQNWQASPVRRTFMAESTPTAAPALDPHKVGMLTFLLSEVAFFGTLIVTFLFFLGPIKNGDPNPAAVFSLPLVLVSTAFLLSSSVTVHMACKRLDEGGTKQFIAWWAATILLGSLFLGGTALEWTDLIGNHHLTISRNIFGTCYFTLVGFHATHVTVGVIMMLIVLSLALRGDVTNKHSLAAELISWYWHFVDGVWIFVFLVVYIVAR